MGAPRPAPRLDTWQGHEREKGRSLCQSGRRVVFILMVEEREASQQPIDCIVCQLGQENVRLIEADYTAGVTVQSLAQKWRIGKSRLKQHLTTCTRVPVEQRSPLVPDPHLLARREKYEATIDGKARQCLVRRLPKNAGPMPATSEEYIKRLAADCWVEFQCSRADGDRHGSQSWAKIIAGLIPAIVACEPGPAELERLRDERPEEFAMYIRRWLPAEPNDGRGSTFEEKTKRIVMAIAEKGDAK